LRFTRQKPSTTGSSTHRATDVPTRAHSPPLSELHMSVATVKAHVSRLLAKLEVDNRIQIALLVQDANGSR
jgi:hypothetical protein